MGCTYSNPDLTDLDVLHAELAKAKRFSSRYKADALDDMIREETTKQKIAERAERKAAMEERAAKKAAAAQA